MFDFGFSEMLLVAIVALIVVGPKRLPTVARTIGHLLGRMQRYVAEVKSDVSREMQLDELKKLQQQVQEQARDLESSIRKQADGIESSVRDTAQDVEQAVAPNDSMAPPMNPPPMAPVSDAEVRTPQPLPAEPEDESQLKLGLGEDVQAEPQRSPESKG